MAHGLFLLLQSGCFPAGFWERAIQKIVLAVVVVLSVSLVQTLGAAVPDENVVVVV